MIDRTKAPQFIRPEYFPLQKVESVVLEGGIPFHYLDSGKQNIVRLEIIFKAGKWHEEKNGASMLAGKLLTEGGTGKYDSFAIGKIFEQNGAFFEVSPGLDFITFSVYCLSKNIHKLIDVVEEIILRPAFADKETEIQKSIQIQNLKVNKEKNSFLATRHFRKKLFGNDHPYGKITDVADIESISKDDLLEFFNNNIKNNFEVILSGHFSAGEVSLLKSFFAGIKKEAHDDHIHPRPGNNQNYNLERSESLQSSIRIGKPVIDKHDSDYALLLIFNEILGGYFGSRLMQNLREDKGFTYGVHSSIVPLLRATYFTISTDVIKKHKEEAVREIHYEISKLIETKVDSRELNTVKNYFKGTFLSGINSPFSLADKFKGIHFHGLNYDFYQDLFENIDAINAEAVREFAERNFAQNNFIEVVVG